MPYEHKMGDLVLMWTFSDHMAFKDFHIFLKGFQIILVNFGRHLA